MIFDSVTTNSSGNFPAAFRELDQSDPPRPRLRFRPKRFHPHSNINGDGNPLFNHLNQKLRRRRIRHSIFLRISPSPEPILEIDAKDPPLPPAPASPSPAHKRSPPSPSESPPYSASAPASGHTHSNASAHANCPSLRTVSGLKSMRPTINHMHRPLILPMIVDFNFASDSCRRWYNFPLEAPSGRCHPPAN